MKHRLKIEFNYLQRLKSGKKKSEIRLNDRDYQLGDVLEYVNFDDDGRHPKVGAIDYHLCFKITHIHSGLGLEKGFVCLSIEPTEIKEG